MNKVLTPFKNFSEFTEEYALSTELPYWDFFKDDHTLSLSDGSLVQGFELQGIDISTWDDDRINQLALQLRSVLNSLTDGAELQWMVDFDSDFLSMINAHESLSNTESPVSWIASDRVSRLRRDVQRNALFRSKTKLFLYERASKDQSKKLSFFGKADNFVAIQKADHEKRLLSLRKQADHLGESLSSLGLKVQVLSTDQIRECIYRFLNPKRSLSEPCPKETTEHREQEFSSQELKQEPALSVESPRSQLCLSDMILNTEGFYLDGLYHRIITLKSLPENTFSAMAARFTALPHGSALSIGLRVPEQSTELSSLQIKRRMAHSMSMSHGGRVTDLESEAKLQSTEDLLRELIQNGQKILYVQVAVLVRDASLEGLDQKVKQILSRFRELSGAEGLTETVASLKVLKSILPAGMTTLVRSKRMKTDNTADFLPIYEPTRGNERAVCLFQNRYGGLQSYDPFCSSLPNFNTLVTGSSGSGKSFLNNCVLLQFASQRPKVFVIDIGGSYRKLCEFMGGSYFEITPPTDQGSIVNSINPMLLPPGEKEPSPHKVKFLLSLLELILTDQEDDRLSRLSKSMIEEAITKTYQRISDREVTLSDLAETFTQSSDQDLKNFARILYPWTGNRPYGRLLDRRGSLNIDSSFVVFDLKGLSAYQDLQSVMILIITDYILGQLSLFPNVYKQILMDECWELLKSKPASHFMEYCVRVLRKMLGGVTFITQGLEEIVQSPIGPAILGNTANKFILLQRGDLDPIRSVLKLNDQEMALIRSLKQRKGSYSEAFMMNNESRSVIRVAPTPIEYWLATSDARDAQLLESARAKWEGRNLKEVIQALSVQFPTGANGVTEAPDWKEAS